MTAEGVVGRCLHELHSSWRSAAARQVRDAGHPHAGGVIHPAWDRAECGPDSEGRLIADALILAVATRRGLISVDAMALLESAGAAAACLIRSMRPGHRIDLLKRHPDDATANAFAMQLVGPALLLARDHADAPGWTAALAPVEEFTRLATIGMLDGGFCTPNHRWVLAGAMAVGGALHPGIAVDPVIAAYLAETIDIDDEGFYLERSVGLYDGFVNRSLLLVDEHRPELAAQAGIRPAVRASLETDRWLLQTDMSAETMLSHRQDRGNQAAGIELAEAYLYAGMRLADDALRGVAMRLLAMPCGGVRCSAFLVGLMLRAPPPNEALASDLHGRRFFPGNGVLRIKHDGMDATFLRNDPRICHLKRGSAEVVRVGIELSYFGHGRFLGEEMVVSEQRISYRSAGSRWHPYWPGFDLPTGQPVPRDRFYALGASGARPWRRLPSFAFALDIEQDGSAFTFHVRTDGGPDGVPAQVYVDLPAGGRWETDDCLTEPAPGQHIFLKRGAGRMRYGTDVVEIGPGMCSHAAWPGTVTDLPGPDRCVRVMLTCVTPVDRVLRIALASSPR